MKVEVIPGTWNINAQERRRRPFCRELPPPLFRKSTKVNYFSLKEFERLEASGRDDGSFKSFSSSFKWSESVTDLRTRRECTWGENLYRFTPRSFSPLLPFPSLSVPLFGA